MNIPLVPVLAAGGKHDTELPARRPRKLTDTLNEAVVIVFFSLGPAIGATIFLMWFCGLTWGLLSTFFR